MRVCRHLHMSKRSGAASPLQCSSVAEAMQDASVGLHNFHRARSEFRAFLVANEELLWRVRRLLPAKDGCRKAAERLLSDCAISAFQSCADECACSFADSMPDRRFPGFESFIHVFYGEASSVESRISEWADQLPRSWDPPPSKRKRVAQSCGPTLLDTSLLRAVGGHAFAFMAATRRLPHFNPRWEAKAVSAKFGFFEVADGNLIAEERRFAKKYAAAMQAMDSAPLVAQDVRVLLLCLHRALGNADAARAVLWFIGKCKGDKLPAVPGPDGT